MTEKPNEEETKKILELTKNKSNVKTEKPRDGIIDKSTKKIDTKESKKLPQDEQKESPDKIDLVLRKIHGLVKRQDRLEELYNKGIVTPTDNPKPKKTTNHEKQTIKTNEELLKEVALEQERAQGKQEPGQQAEQPQVQPFQQSPEYAKLSDKEKVKTWEERARQQQVQAQQQGQQQQQINKGRLTNKDLFFGALEVAKIFKDPVVEAIKAKASEGRSPDFFESIGLGKTFLLDIVKQSVQQRLGLSPGSDNRGMLRQELQNERKQALQDFFSFLKIAPKKMAEGIVTERIEKAPTFGLESSSSSRDGIIPR